jgi:hypothetical protein
MGLDEQSDGPEPCDKATLGGRSIQRRAVPAVVIRRGGPTLIGTLTIDADEPGANDAATISRFRASGHE